MTLLKTQLLKHLKKNKENKITGSDCIAPKFIRGKVSYQQTTCDTIH